MAFTMSMCVFVHHIYGYDSVRKNSYICLHLIGSISCILFNLLPKPSMGKGLEEDDDSSCFKAQWLSFAF